MNHGLDRYHIAVIALAFFAFFMAALVSRTAFERLPHIEDELSYIFQARTLARGEFAVDIPEPRRAFWQPFVIDHQPTGLRFGKYPPGWPALLAAGEWLGQMWIINAFLAMFGVVFVYRLGREIYNPDAGLIAAALTAFSPMALLLNATLMAHTAALAFFTLFMWAYWRMERHTSAHRSRAAALWGLTAGFGLGMVAASRPMTALALVLPFVLWSGLRLLRAAWADFAVKRITHLPMTLVPLLLIAIPAALLGAVNPLYSYATTGDASLNLYTLIWPYDQLGFGECCGRREGGHNIITGIFHTRLDLSLTAADLFGWQIGTITPELQDHLRTSSHYWPLIGLSFVLLPFGLLAGFRRWWLAGWLVIGMAWLIVPLALDMDFLRDEADPSRAWLWLLVMAAWMLIPPLLLIMRRRDDADNVRPAWTWLLLASAVTLIAVHLAYWVGSQRFSTRYYAETLTIFALLSALGPAWLMRRIGRGFVYGVLIAALVWSLYLYSTPRITALYRFNNVSAAVLEAVEARRADPDRPALVLIDGSDGPVSWRAFGTLMAVTGPYLDDDIVAAWDYAPGDNIRAEILERFPEREIIEMAAHDDRLWFDEPPCAGIAVHTDSYADCMTGHNDD